MMRSSIKIQMTILLNKYFYFTRKFYQKNSSKEPNYISLKK